MPIELSNNISFSRTPVSGDETITGQVNQNATQAQRETGPRESTVLLTENSQRLNKLHTSLSTLPVVDSQRVAAVKQKLSTMAILDKSPDARLASASRIVEGMFAVDPFMTEDLSSKDT